MKIFLVRLVVWAAHTVFGHKKNNNTEQIIGTALFLRCSAGLDPLYFHGLTVLIYDPAGSPDLPVFYVTNHKLTSLAQTV